MSGPPREEADLAAGALILVKTTTSPRGTSGPVGTRRTGLRQLDGFLRETGGHALPAFPFDRRGTTDRVGLDRWLVLDLPGPVELASLIRRIHSVGDLLPETILVEDPAWFRVRARLDWPIPLVPAREDRLGSFGSTGSSPPPPLAPRAPKLLRRIGVQEAWSRTRGEGVGVAVVGTGLDVNHTALSASLRTKPDERPRRDNDGNGLPGDDFGINLAHLAVAHGAGPPFLALGLVSDLSDWAGSPGPRRGRGTVVAALAAGRRMHGGSGGVAPEAWVLGVDVEENRAVTVGRAGRPDPRMDPSHNAPLRSPLWSRAAGIVYAVTEGARVVTCVWPPVRAHAILHDALSFAEDNCALPVCAPAGPAGPGEVSGFAPARWRRDWLHDHGGGAGALIDGWSGELLPDRADRPLRATLVVGGLDPKGRPLPGALTTQPDLFAPAKADAPVSTPANDGTPAFDVRTAPYTGPAVAAGLTAGVAALVLAARPDLEPDAVRGALLGGAGSKRGHRWLDAAGALREAWQAPAGRCEDLDSRRARVREARRPFWKRLKLKVKARPIGRQPDPSLWP